ncbi:MAG: ABC transporter ATP-binding protein [Clostridium septicum]|uniref:ABC transporter ATP-binding protein n=1 Tax=Clostridium septicum TaxID=1504 RepID=UPI002589D4B4|nr:ABC transporter ATP-binding protein [Clostridium septicum]MDU1313569.1 ABC transporter ATP-binding protein [Clostridium septicum]
MITLNNVNKKFGDTEILKNININLEKNKIYGFEGKNGSGKTVLFKMICGFIAPSSGKILINNKQIGKDIDFPEKCGILIESPGFIDRFSAYKNLKLLADINRTISDSEIKNWMDFYDLEFNSKKKVKNFSLGMKQKLGLIQAFMEEPNILILDEPMNALDEKSVIKTRELLNSLKNNTIILISSHNKEDIESLCDEIFLIDNGIITKK